MATTFKIKRFSAKTDAMKKVVEDANYREIIEKGDKFKTKVNKFVGNTKKDVAEKSRAAGRWVIKNPGKSAGIAGGVALTGIAINGGVKGWKAKKTAEKTFSIQRLKTFSDDQKKSGSFLKKAALGTVAVGTGLLAAKKGAFGGTAMKAVNKGLAQAGTKVGAMESKLGLKTNIGNKMLDSGVKGYGQGAVKQMTSGLAKNGKTATDAMKTNAANVAEGRLLNKLVS